LIQGPQVTTRTEIGQLDNAIAAFQAKFAVKGPFPSKLRLCKKVGDYNQNNQLDKDSYEFIHRMFPRIDDTVWGNGNGFDWNGQGATNSAVTLDGDQCLVFFLGGIPDLGSRTCQGFSTNPRNPTDLSTNDRIGPFYEFKSNRLVARNGYFSYR